MANNVYRVTVLGTIFGNQVQNVLHFIPSGVIGTDVQAMASEIQTGWCTLLKPSFSGDIKWHGCIIQELARPLTVATTVNWTPIQGNLTTNGAPPQIALCMSLTSNLAGKSYRGRIYISGLQGGNTLLGVFTDAAKTNYQNMINTLKARYLIGGANFSGMELRIFSRKRYATGLDSVQASVSVANISYNSVPATQRRRRHGVGV